MVALTRSVYRNYVRAAFEGLPDELLIEVLSHLPERSLGMALSSCKRFHACKEPVWKAACAKRWPQWYEVAQRTRLPWRREYELLSLRERELLVVPSAEAMKKTQTVVNEQNRAVLAEWLAEVSWDWSLESTIVFKAVAYLDHYLMKHDVPALSGFQLVGIGCLRAAMMDTPQRTTQTPEEEQKAMDPARFSYISDQAYTAQQVQEMTAVVQKTTTEALRTCPNAKMFLRSFWYRSVQMGIISQEEMHIYTLASFLLQLALLDLQCSLLPASELAAAALANSLEIFGKDVWPSMLGHYAAYTAKDLAGTRAKLHEVQASLPAEHIRLLWKSHHEHHGYDEYKEEWAHALQLMALPHPIAAVKCHSSSSTASEQTTGPAVS